MLGVGGKKKGRVGERPWNPAVSLNIFYGKEGGGWIDE